MRRQIRNAAGAKVRQRSGWVVWETSKKSDISVCISPQRPPSQLGWITSSQVARNWDTVEKADSPTMRQPQP